MPARITQVEVENLLAPTASSARVTQLEVEALLAIGVLRGDAGIATAEVFGSGGSITAEAGDLTVTGSAGVVSAEAFGSGGSLNAPYIAGTAGIDESAMGSSGSLVAGLIAGTAGIDESATGVGGSVSGPIAGTAGINESAMGAGGSVSGPVTGGAGIVSAEAFGAAGVVAGPILASTGIASLETFGANGDIRQPVTGLSGIVSAEAFGAGGVTAGMRGYIGITSAETFGRTGAVLASGATVGHQLHYHHHLFIRGLAWTDLLRADSLTVTKQLGGRGQAQFTLVQTGTGYRPSPGDEVEYYVGFRKLFGGFIKTVEEEYFVSTNTFVMRCTASDYRELCDVRTFARVYEGPTHTLSTIVRDIMAATLTAEGITYESREDYTITGGKLSFNDEQVSQALDRTCAVFGCDWRIDDYRRLRIERRLADLAPRTLSDNDGNWSKMVVKRTEAQYRNRQGARTSTPTAGQRSATLAGAGAWTYTLPFQLKSKPTILVNDVAKTVVLYSQRHTQPWDFAYELDGSTIYHNPAQSAYTSSDEIVVTALSGTLDVYWAENTADIARRAQQTGGSGIVEAVSRATNIRDANNAARFTEGMLARLGQATVEVSVELSTCDMGPPVQHVNGRAGWDIGQMVSIACARPLVFGDFVVTLVSFREVGLTYLEYAFSATGRELPTVLGVAIDGGPGAWEVTVTVDRPVDWTPGTDITLWGLNNTGPTDPLNGTWIIDTIEPEPITGGVNIRFNPPPDIDLTGYVYTGGLGGTDGSGGSGFGGSTDPFGGIITTSGILPEAPTGGGGISNPDPGALIVDNVNTSTREVTTDRDHNFTTSYPSFDTGTRVVIMGVRGAEDATHSINTPFSRITVTGARTFIAEDVGPFSSPSPFEDDQRGRVYTTDQAPRANAGGGNPNWNTILQQLAAEGTEGNTAGSNATFLLANSVPGFASRPLMVMNAATNAWVQQRDLQVVESVNVEVGTPSQGGPIRIDIKKNGASIFADGYVEIPAGETSVRTSNLAQTPTVVEKDDQLQPDVVAVGSEFPGCNVRVDVVLRG